MNEVVAARVWQGMRALVQDRYDRRREVCAALDLSFSRVKALRLVRVGPTTMGQLAEKLTTDAPYTTLVVDDLERRGLVRRDPHPTDRRSRMVTITADGVAVAERAEEILDRPPAPVLDLDPEDLATLDRLVTKLLAPDSSSIQGSKAGDYWLKHLDQ
jgi:DNA-binding MarR family transcriptional regulator